MTLVDSLMNELNEAGTRVSSMFEPRVATPIGTIGLEPEPIADKYGPKKEYRNDAYKDTVPLGYRSAQDIGQLYRLIESEHGVNIHKVSQKYLVDTFGSAHGGKAPIAWRTGNDIYMAGDDGGRPLAYAELKAVLMHEIFAGYDHQNSDKEAQLGAIEALSPSGKYADPIANKKAIEFAPRVDLDPSQLGLYTHRN